MLINIHYSDALPIFGIVNVIYVTASVEAQCRLISRNQKTKEEDNIKNTKVNDLKRDAHMNQCAKLFAKLVTNLPNGMMASEDNSTPHLQFILSLSTEIIKDSYQNFVRNMDEFSDLKKRTVAAAIVRKWVRGSVKWEVMHAYREDAFFCDTWQLDIIAVVILPKHT